MRLSSGISRSADLLKLTEGIVSVHRRLISVIGLIFILASCGNKSENNVSQPPISASVDAAPPHLAASGPTDLFGLRLELNPTDWQILGATQSQATLQYKPQQKDCSTGKCPMLLVSTSQSEFYRLNVAGEELVVNDECSTGTSAFQPPQFQGMVPVAGHLAKYYINPWCDRFEQGGTSPRIRRNWLFAPEGLLVQEVQGFDGSGITGFDAILRTAAWR